MTSPAGSDPLAPGPRHPLGPRPDPPDPALASGPVARTSRRGADPLTYLALVAAIVIWAGSYLVITVALASFTPLALTALRLALSSGCLWVYARGSGETLAVPRRDLWPLLGIGFLLNTVFQVCLNAALFFTTPAHASLAVAGMPIFAAVAARPLLGERLTAGRAAAILMAFAGVALIILSGEEVTAARNAVLGDLLALGTALSWALGSVLSKPFLARYSALKLSTLTLVGGAVSGIPLGVMDLLRTPWGAVTGRSWLALIYLSVLSMAVGWVLWHRGIARVDVSQAAIFNNLTPVATVFLSALLLGEPLTAPLLGGGALVLAGAYLAQRT